MTSGASLTIGLLSWNGAKTLPACLDSLAAQSNTDWNLVVVDNDSGDDSRSIIAGWCATHLPPQRWQLVRMRRNVGYAAGMNAIAMRSQSPYLLALNQDVALHPQYIARMLPVLDADPEIGAICGRIYQTSDLAIDAPALIASDDPLGWGRGRLLDSTGHQLYRDRIVMNRRHGVRDTGVDLAPETIFGCPGSCPIYRRAALLDVCTPLAELWDSRFFAYLEDVDIDYRLQLGGYLCRHQPDAVALHQPHGSGGRATFPIRFRAHMNRYRILAMHESWSSLAPDLGPILAQEAYQLLRTTLSNPLLHFSAIPFLLQSLTGAYRNRHRGLTIDRRFIETTPRWQATKTLMGQEAKIASQDAVETGDN